MDDNTKINYIFTNELGETVNMTFTIVEVEGMTGGFINHILEHLNEVGFGEPTNVRRLVTL